VAIGGATIALLTRDGHESAVPTDGPWAPITVSRPNIPVIGGGVPVDLDPLISRSDLSTTLTPLSGAHRYGITIANTSNLGAINAFQWYPPTGVHIVKVLGSTQGHCTLTGLEGFGGNQFPGLVLYPNVFCKELDLKAPSCTCLGDGGAVTISFVTENEYGGGSGELRLRAATLAFDKVPSFLKPGATAGTPQ
jgi:hypothetical protein